MVTYNIATFRELSNNILETPILLQILYILIYNHLSRKNDFVYSPGFLILLYIFDLTCPNRYEHLMFFDPLVISEIIKKARIFFRKNTKVKNKKLIFQ